MTVMKPNSSLYRSTGGWNSATALPGVTTTGSAPWRIARLLVALLAGVLCGTDVLDAQFDMRQYNTAPRERELTFLRLPGVSPDYRLGPGDQIEVTIVGTGRDPSSYTIDRAGEIAVPPMQNIRIADLTAEEAEAAISAALKREGLMQGAEVLVYISAYQARPVYAVGELDRPGQYFMSQRWTLMDLIFVAGGIDPLAARYAYLHRRLDDSSLQMDSTGLLANPAVALPGTEVTQIDLKPMIDGGVLSSNPVLRTGDVLVIPKIQTAMYSVLGDVLSPGVFEVPARTGIRVSQAILWAGGPGKSATPSKGIVLRYAKDGTRQEIPLDYSGIMGGQTPDFEVQPNDMIFIPGSLMKTIGQGAMVQLPRILTMRLLFRPW